MENIHMNAPFHRDDRRQFLQMSLGIVAAGGLVVPARAQGLTDKAEQTVGVKPADVTPPEDLMREHGVLDRVLLIYEAAMRKFAASEDFDPKVISNSAQVVRDFIENYHEQSEEKFVFPRFRKAGKLTDLVDTLLEQHQAGRRLTEKLLQHAAGSRKDGDDRAQSIAAMQAFIFSIGRMRLARIPICSPSCARLSQHMSSTPWGTIWKNKRNRNLARMASRKWRHR
jgi:hypothetical protein